MKSKFSFLGLILSLLLSAQAKILNIDCHDPALATDDIVEGYNANVTALFSDSQEDERHVIFNLPGRGLSMIKQAVTGFQSGSFSRFVIYECSVN